jgi:hypothetical protein
VIAGARMGFDAFGVIRGAAGGGGRKRPTAAGASMRHAAGAGLGSPRHNSPLNTRPRIPHPAIAQGVDKMVVRAQVDPDVIAGDGSRRTALLRAAPIAVRNAALRGTCSRGTDARRAGGRCHDGAPVPTTSHPPEAPVSRGQPPNPSYSVV